MPIKPIIAHKGEKAEGRQVDSAAEERVAAVMATAEHVIAEGGRMITAFTIAFSADGVPMVQGSVDSELEGVSTLTIAVADMMPYKGSMVDTQQGAGLEPAHLAELSFGGM
jgi:hypothetical protein